MGIVKSMMYVYYMHCMPFQLEGKSICQKPLAYGPNGFDGICHSPKHVFTYSSKSLSVIA